MHSIQPYQVIDYDHTKEVAIRGGRIPIISKSDSSYRNNNINFKGRYRPMAYVFLGGQIFKRDESYACFGLA